MSASEYDVLIEGIRALFLIGVPTIVALSVVGTIVAAFQAATTISEPALGYAARVAALVVLMYFLFPAFARTCVNVAQLAFR